MLNYPIELTPDDNDTLLVTFLDFPEAVTYGEDEDDACIHAIDALESVLNTYITDRRAIPEPSPARGRQTVSPSLLGSLKVAVYRAMRERDWRKADLARAMGLNPRQVDRLLDLRHGSTVAQLEQALTVCGKRAEIETRELAHA